MLGDDLMKVLVTGATGMFGSKVCELLDKQGIEVLALTRNAEHAERMTRGTTTGIVGDLDDPDTLKPALDAADRMFLVSPMHEDLGTRESGAIRMASECGLDQIVKLYGSVRHEGDLLDRGHQLAIESLRKIATPWTLVSPQTVMETNLLGQAEGLRLERAMYGSAGDGKIGMVALEDCVEVAALALQSAPSALAGENLEITGPEALTYTEIADEMSQALGCTIRYVDMPEAEFSAMLLEYGMNADEIELQVLCHFRQMRLGKASLVTDTFEELTGKKPTSVRAWTRLHRRELGFD